MEDLRGFVDVKLNGMNFGKSYKVNKSGVVYSVGTGKFLSTLNTSVTLTSKVHGRHVASRRKLVSQSFTKPEAPKVDLAALQDMFIFNRPILF